MKIPQNLIVRVLIFTGALLLIPLAAMLVSDGADWSISDFVIAGVLIATIGLGFELLSRSSKSNRKKLIIGIGLALVFFLVWGELAVGLFGTPFAGD